MTKLPPHSKSSSRLRVVCDEASSSQRTARSKRPAAPSAHSTTSHAAADGELEQWRIDAASTTGADHTSAITPVLADATLATGTIAAAVYLLDDETENLVNRFVFGMTAAGRVDQSRSLRGSRTDLEAMIQGIVAVENAHAGPVDTWKFPEPYPAAICACIGEIDFPVGTLWLFSDVEGEFENAATAAARLAAVNIDQVLRGTGLASHSGTAAAPNPSLSILSQDDDIAAPLDFHEIDPPAMDAVALGSVKVTPRESTPQHDAAPAQPILRSRVEPVVAPETASGRLTKSLAETTSKARRFDKMIDHVAGWQHRTLPVGTRLAEDWLVDGLIESPIEVAQSWHHWDVLPDGTLSIAICQTNMAGLGQIDIQDVLTATLSRAALQAHASYRHRPEDAVLRVLETLWQIDDHVIDDGGRSAMSMMYGHVDPESGQADIASMGRWSTLIASRHGYRPLGDRDRLTESDAGQHPMDRRPTTLQTRLQPGEVMMIGGAWIAPDGIGAASMGPGAAGAATQSRIGNSLVAALRNGKQHPLSAVQRLLADVPLQHERTAITLHRRTHP